MKSIKFKWLKFNRYHSNLLAYSAIFIISGLSLRLIPKSLDYADLMKEVLISIFSAVLLFIFLEMREIRRDKKLYGKIIGTFKRIDIFYADRTKTSDTIYFTMSDRYKHIDPLIELHYSGDREYTFEAEYEEGRKRGVLFLNATNPFEGDGNYQYISKKSNRFIMPDIGHYTLHIDKVNPNRFYLFHMNQIPSGLAEGYEIFERA